MRKLVFFLSLVPMVCFAQENITLPVEWYFHIAPVKEDVIADVKVPDKIVQVEILDEEGNPTGETKPVQTYKILKDQKIGEVTKIADEICPNATMVGTHLGTPIYSVLVNTGEDLAKAERLKKHAKWLGTPKEVIARKDALSKAILYNLIEVDDGEGGKMMKRVSQTEWESLGKPKTFDKWRLHTEWFLTSKSENKIELKNAVTAVVIPR